MCSAQSSKTQTLLALICWIISEDPGPTMWVLNAADEAKDFLVDRAGPTLDLCKPVREQHVSSEKLSLRFRSMPLYFTGANSKSKLQGKPIRWLFLDEVRNYPKGAFYMVKKRIRANWNSRTFVVSTPGDAGDPVDITYRSGNQMVWHFPCPKCGEFQQLDWQQMKWDKNETTKPNGKWDFNRLTETIRYVCKHCGHEIRDTPAERRHIEMKGKYVSMNPTAPKHIISFHWNAMLPKWVTWASLVEEFILAVQAARGGDTSALRTFITESLGQPWTDDLGIIDDFGFLAERQQDYDFGEVWPEEVERFMAADKQEEGGEHYWWGIRAYGPFGKSRLISYGRANTEEELDAIREKHGVQRINAVIDCGFKQSDTFRFCMRYGWKPFKGMPGDMFVVADEDSGETVRRLWRAVLVDPFSGTKNQGKMSRFWAFQFASDPTMDLLAEYMTGRVGDWSIPKKIGSEYLKQVTAESRVVAEDALGHTVHKWVQRRKANHLFDVEKMLLICAVARKIIASGDHVASKPKKEAATASVAS